MSGAARNPEDVLASIRRLVAREVETAQAREASERTPRAEPPVLSEAARDATRLVLGPEDRIAANGRPAAGVSDTAGLMPTSAASPDTGEPERVTAPEDAPAAASTGMDEEALRDLIREILREEVRTRMGPRINANIRRIVREELIALFDGSGVGGQEPD